jgi:hypothetical protein
MKRFSTLMTAVAVFFTVQANAQNYSENFETALTSSGHGCVDTTDIMWASQAHNVTKKYVITGSGSAYAEPPVSGTTVRVFGSPYLSLLPSTTISFKYQLTSNLQGGATRFINVGTIDSLGNFTSIDSFGLVWNNTTIVSKSYNVTFPGTTVRRVAIRVGGAGGDGNSRVAFDDIAVNAPMYNGGVCNMAPIAVNDFYYPTLSGQVYSGNVITDGSGNDRDPDGGTLTAQVLSAPDAVTVGTLVFNTDGSFSFTPVAAFTGGLVTFTYRIADNGYAIASATATVTLDYPAPIFTPMPVKLMSFAGSIANNKAQLRWSVADNETGDHFQVLRSVDGKNFTEAGMVFINNKVGAESYNFTDKQDLDAVTYYKLKVVNKDKSVTYSNVIILKNATGKNAAGISILKNPVESTLTFTYTAASATQSNVAIYSASGVKVYSSRLSSQKGINAVSLSLDSHMVAGTYILEVTNGAERMVTKLLKK